MVVNPPPTKEKTHDVGLFFRLVAEVGFEHYDLQVMGLTSYHCSTPRSVLVSPYDLRAIKLLAIFATSVFTLHFSLKGFL